MRTKFDLRYQKYCCIDHNSLWLPSICARVHSIEVIDGRFYYIMDCYGEESKIEESDIFDDSEDCQAECDKRNKGEG